MSRMRGWVVFGVAMLALAGCMTTGGQRPSSGQQADKGVPVPGPLQKCGDLKVGTELFEICGIGPEGRQAAVTPHQIQTEICGPVAVTDDVKAYLCQKADAIFNAINPYRAEAVIAANFPDKTRAFYSKEGGNEIHYLAANGKGYFWLPNHSTVLAGEWIIFRNQQVCYDIPGVTEHPGTKWRCSPIRSPGLAEIAEGDLLGLAKRGGAAAPWSLQSQPRITLAEAKLRMNTAPAQKKGGAPAQAPSRGPAEPVPVDPLAPMS